MTTQENVPNRLIGLSPERYIEGAITALQEGLSGFRKGALTEGDLYATLTKVIAVLELAQSNLQVLIDTAVQVIAPQLEEGE